MSVLLIDHQDSFVHNLARYVGLLGRERMVVRYHDLSLAQIKTNPPNAIILSPGPCTPTQIPNTIELITRFAPDIPILGVCLGHQAIGEAYGGKTLPAPHPVHGKASLINHRGTGLFQGLPDPFSAARYHSLISSLPGKACALTITAQCDNHLPMAFAHQSHPVYSVQFHPESCLTEYGIDIIRNFLNLADDFHVARKVKE